MPRRAQNSEPSWWEVFSPEFSGPSFVNLEAPDYGRDWVCVQATTKRDAIRLGVKKMLKEFPRGWCAENRACGSPPWKDAMAERLPEHGPSSDPQMMGLCDVCGEEWPCGGWDALE